VPVADQIARHDDAIAEDALCRVQAAIDLRRHGFDEDAPSGCAVGGHA
jgi:hypothetical protein